MSSFNKLYWILSRKDNDIRYTFAKECCTRHEAEMEQKKLREANPELSYYILEIA